MTSAKVSATSRPCTTPSRGTPRCGNRRRSSSRTPNTAFNKNRRPSDLLREQIEHLEWAAHPTAERRPGMLPKVTVKTEGQAAERIATLTAAVLTQARENANARAASAATPAAAAV